MSFILDALKKSEAERQRQAGPTLLELRITQPRRRYPLWALVVGGLLAVNAVVLLVVLLRRPAPLGVASAPAAVAAAPVATAPVAATPTAAASRGAAPAASAAPAPVGTAAQAVPPLASTEGPAAAPATSATAAAPGAADQSAPSSADLAARGAASPPRNPADYEPAVAPASGTVQPGAPTDYASLPSLSSLSGNVPALQLNMLVNSDRPSERYALINMHRVHEGDMLPEGARVLAITHDGVAMEYHGQDFLLRMVGAAPQ